MGNIYAEAAAGNAALERLLRRLSGLDISASSSPSSSVSSSVSSSASSSVSSSPS